MTQARSLADADLAFVGPRFAGMHPLSIHGLQHAIVEDQPVAKRFFASDAPVGIEEVGRYLRACNRVIEVRERSTGEIAGGLFVTTQNPYARQCFLSSLSVGRAGRRSLVFEATVIFIDQLFRSTELHRIRFDVLDFNLTQFKSILRVDGVEHEGVRKDWAFFDGEYRDAFLFSISQAGWRLRGRPLADRLRRRADHRE